MRVSNLTDPTAPPPPSLPSYLRFLLGSPSRIVKVKPSLTPSVLPPYLECGCRKSSKGVGVCLGELVGLQRREGAFRGP